MMKIIFYIGAISALAVSVRGKSSSTVRCMGSFSGDMTEDGRYPSAAPSETVSPTCERGQRPAGPDECVDSADWTLDNVPDRGCGYVALDIARCALDGAKENCPQVCDECPEQVRATYPPTLSPTLSCVDLDDQCEPVLVNDEVIRLCEWLQSMEEGERERWCGTKYYRAVKKTRQACGHLERYPKARAEQCDAGGTYTGDLYQNNPTLGRLKIAYSEICGQTCGTCF
uniref:ShKT domain-containing protein n=1 Tax=Corethron hystrix TaxID=216773 RepID=A0A7S1BPR8_9STRA|mmetsp:Transcript_36594/g.85531  ORF Transcript_36594/g.85531 Transcript_36594/m.85531 type:complete len:228 (+) Transcript_36594:132-815(+)